MPRIRKVPRPEGGGDIRSVYTVPHRCDLGRSLRRAGMEDPDLLEFNLGAHGGHLPANATFDVGSTEPCPACGAVVRAWFQWVDPVVVPL